MISENGGLSMGTSKWARLLQSRKFWASIISLAAAVGLLEYSEAQQAELVQAIVVVATALGYVFSVALEDGLSHRR